MSADISPMLLPPQLLSQVKIEPFNPVTPSATEIDQFAQRLAALRLQPQGTQQQANHAIDNISNASVQLNAVASSSDQAMLNALQADENEVKKRFQLDRLNNIQDPDSALRAQGEVAMTVLRLELLTRFANGISQGINKLTSMA